MNNHCKCITGLELFQGQNDCEARSNCRTAAAEPVRHVHLSSRATPRPSFGQLKPFNPGHGRRQLARVQLAFAHRRQAGGMSGEIRILRNTRRSAGETARSSLV
jgi:hypothetical protein